MRKNRIADISVRRRGTALGAAAVLALTGLVAASPAGAADDPSRLQEPRARLVQSPAPAAAAADVVPGAPTDPAEFAMRSSSDLGPKVTALDNALFNETVPGLLGDANRPDDPNLPCATDPFGAAGLPPAVKYCFDRDDSLTREWIPQAVTGAADAEESGVREGKRPILVGSYDAWNPGRDDPWPETSEGKGTPGNQVCASTEPGQCNEKGVRVTFFDPDTKKYRHVLLVWPYTNSAGNTSFDAIEASEQQKPAEKGIHAGGMVWYRDFLYVADTFNGVRVFDLRHILDLNPDNDSATNDRTQDGLVSNVQDGRQVGRHSNVWYSYGYRYVMPQVASWTFAAPQHNDPETYLCSATGAPRASYLSLDRTVVPHQLLLGEYCRPDGNLTSTGRIGAFPMDAATGSIRASGGLTEVAPRANFLPVSQVQGAARQSGKYYFNQSHGHANGDLWRAAPGQDGTLAVRGTPVKSAVGVEDMYVDRDAGGPLLWSVSEHRANLNTTSCADASPCGRVLYAHRLADVDSAP